jgi:hypothetical protein
MIMTLHMLCSILHVLSICFSVQRNPLCFRNAADTASKAIVLMISSLIIEVTQWFTRTCDASSDLVLSL